MDRDDILITVVTMVPTLCALAATPAQASEAVELAPQGRIVGGEITQTCHWPNAASLSGGCTGTLVHPEIVTTAKHCISNPNKTISFGERSSGGKLSVKASCKAWKGPGDMAYCKLAKPVTTVPIVPILMGCELAALENKGLDVALVGFGRTSGKASDYGTKREVLTPLHDGPGAGGSGVKEAEILVGHETKGACNGDSGGPAYIDLRKVEEFKDKPGAGWRVFGVTSRPGPGAKVCLGTTVYGMIHKMVDWIESDSGIDITPCFDADGTWKPGAECKDFPDPQAGGSWDSCDAGPPSGYSHVCGEHPDDKGGGEKSGGEKSGGKKSGGEKSGGNKSEEPEPEPEPSEEKTESPSESEEPSTQDSPTPEPTPSEEDSDPPGDKTAIEPPDSGGGGCAIHQEQWPGAALGLSLLLLWRRRRS